MSTGREIDVPPGDALHDALSAGELVQALSRFDFSPAAGAESPATDAGLAARLPLLLRWLSLARPLATPPSSPAAPQDCVGARDAAAPPDTDALVPLLEVVAAAHPDAENVEVLVSALARWRVKRVPPLSRTKTGKDGVVWDTSNLDVILEGLAAPSAAANSSLKRQKKQHHHDGGKRQKLDATDARKVGAEGTGDDEITDLCDESDVVNAGERDAEPGAMSGDEGTALSSVFATVTNDSHDAALRRALQELTVLVKSSLCEAGDDSHDGEAEEACPSSARRPGLNASSSSLAEADEASASLSGGWSRPSVLVPALMQYAPILRHEHVAVRLAHCAPVAARRIFQPRPTPVLVPSQEALCRTAAPRAPTLVARLAANCPPAAAALLRGCLAAYRAAEDFRSASHAEVDQKQAGEEERNSKLPDAGDIARTAVASVERLAALSRREALRVVRVLQERGGKSPM